MDPYVEPHLDWRLLEPSHLPAIEGLRHQLEALDNSVLYGMADSVLDLVPRLADGMAVGGWDAYDSLLAYGLGYVDETPGELRIYLTGGVHPTRRNQSIGTHLFAWQVAAAEEWRDKHRPGEPMRLGCYAELGRTGLERIAIRLGFTPERFFYDMQRDLSRPIDPVVVPGIEVVEFTLDRSQEVLDLHNHCFEDRVNADSDRMWHERVADPTFRPEWSYVALMGGRVVGYAMSGEEPLDGEERLGWTERFGVDPEFRGRGIALSLLAHCLMAMRRDGCTEAGIGVDTEYGAGIPRLCGELGYVTRDAIALLSKAVG